MKIPGIPNSKFFVSSNSKPLTIDALEENLLFIISAWKKVIDNVDAIPTSTEEDIPRSSNFQSFSTTVQVNSLKPKLVEEAETERQKKVKKYQKANNKQTSDFPGESIVGKRIKHRYEVTKSGKVVKQWFKGNVLRVATEEELRDICEEDQDIVSQGYTLFMMKYDNEDQIEPFALKWDWDNGELKLL